MEWCIKAFIRASLADVRRRRGSPAKSPTERTPAAPDYPGGGSRRELTHDRPDRVVAIMLRLTAFSLAGGGGLHLGWSYFKQRGPCVGPTWFRVPRQALIDVGWLYLLVVPLFALGSGWEFLGPR
jgi:hypothetical protein